jgi:phosphatidylcholine synthase
MARKRKVAAKPAEISDWLRIRAFSVHIFTASGAACALFALIAAMRADWAAMFGWLGAALFIDGVDGTLARRFRIAKILPRWSGDSLDLVVDFTTYVFVPAFAIAASGLLPETVAIPLAAAIVISSAIYFSDRKMKTKDNYFRGFPVLWNGAIFHLFVLKLAPWAAACAVAALIVLTFIPVRFIHPFRVERLRFLSIALLALWSILALYALYCSLDPGRWAAWVGTLCAGYLLTADLLFPANERS